MKLMESIARVFGIERRYGGGGIGNWYSAGGTSEPRTLGTYKNSSGEVVNEATVMALSAYFGALRAISEDIGKLPFIVYEKLERGKDRKPDHPVYRLLHDTPNPDMTAISFRETVTQHAIAWGNGYAEIVRTRGGIPVELWPLDPTRVRKDRVGEQIIYKYRNDDRTEVVLRQEDVLDIHGLGFDGYYGYDIAQIAREALGSALAAQKYTGAYFGNGTIVSAIIKHPQKLSDNSLETLRHSWQARHGGAANSGKVAILDQGMDFSLLGIDPQKSQMIETRQFNIEDVCRWFRISPHKLGVLGRAAGWSTLEATNTDYVTDTLMPWMVRWEQECNRKLFKESEPDLFVEHLVIGLLRGDQAARADFYTKLFNIGVLNINDIREAENLNPIGPEGDVHYVPLNIAPINGRQDDVEEQQQEVIEEEPATEQPDELAPTEPEGSDERKKEEILEFMAICNKRVFRGILKSILHVESDKAKRADSKGQITQWAKEFYQDHRGRFVELVGPWVHSFCQSTWVAINGEIMPDRYRLDVDKYVSDMASRHISLSVAEVTNYPQWETHRLDQSCNDEIGSLCNLVKGFSNGS